jgi:hypothetical protein
LSNSGPAVRLNSEGRAPFASSRRRESLKIPTYFPIGVMESQED